MFLEKKNLIHTDSIYVFLLEDALNLQLHTSVLLGSATVLVEVVTKSIMLSVELVFLVKDLSWWFLLAPFLPCPPPSDATLPAVGIEPATTDDMFEADKLLSSKVEFAAELDELHELSC